LEITRGDAAARAREALVVLPIGAIEQHGPHLPLGTDFLIVDHLARAAAEEARVSCDILVAPTLPFGSSHHHLPFGGTVSVATEHYYGVLRDMVESLVTSGFRRVFILNGHGGNHEIAQLVVRDLALTHPANFAAASYWDLARSALAEYESQTDSVYPGHAGLFETSLILALRSDLVASPLPKREGVEMERARMPRFPFRAERHGFWRSIDGHTDSPHEATAERGRQLLAIIVPAVAVAFSRFANLPLVARD
jgi:creatinine amidohydrolase